MKSVKKQRDSEFLGPDREKWLEFCAVRGVAHRELAVKFDARTILAI